MFPTSWGSGSMKFTAKRHEKKMASHVRYVYRKQTFVTVLPRPSVSGTYTLRFRQKLITHYSILMFYFTSTSFQAIHFIYCGVFFNATFSTLKIAMQSYPEPNFGRGSMIWPQGLLQLITCCARHNDGAVS